jgi:hypothetical protein
MSDDADQREGETPVTIEPVADVPTEPVIDVAASLTQPTDPALPSVSVDTSPLAPMPGPEIREVVREVYREVPIERIVEKVSSGEREPASGSRAQDSLRSFPGPNEWTAPVKEVIKEVTKEVPVDRIVHDAPTKEEFEAMLHDYLRRLSAEGIAKKHELMLAKEEAILALAKQKGEIRHADVVDLLECSGTTATRLLHLLYRDGRLVLHGSETHPGYHSGHSARYTLR